MIRLEVDCVTPLHLLYDKYAGTMDINGHLGKCTVVQKSDLSCRHHGHQRTRGQVCSPAKYDSHDSPENVMTHEVEGALLKKYAYMSQEVRGHPRKVGP